MRPDEPMRATGWDENGRPIAWSRKSRQGEREDFYYKVAMIDAYFSRLEHLLVLLLPFTNFTAAGEALLKFIGTNGDGKFKTISDIATNPAAKSLYDRLKLRRSGFEIRYRMAASKMTVPRYTFTCLGLGCFRQH